DVESGAQVLPCKNVDQPNQAAAQQRPDQAADGAADQARAEALEHLSPLPAGDSGKHAQPAAGAGGNQGGEEDDQEQAGGLSTAAHEEDLGNQQADEGRPAADDGAVKDQAVEGHRSLALRSVPSENPRTTSPLPRPSEPEA